MILVTLCTIFMGVASAMPSYDKYEESSSANEVQPYNFPFVSRSQWGARTPRDQKTLVTPVPYVVIHHTFEPAACYSLDECSRAMKSMQNYHMDTRKWSDIGYNFGVGSDGTVYEGRGWQTLGAHALSFNPVSVGITLIGDWTKTVPSSQQLKAAKSLIEAGVELGYVKRNYKLLGHRQVRDTVCPGDALYQELQHWPHYSPHPSSVAELDLVPELARKS